MEAAQARAIGKGATERSALAVLCAACGSAASCPAHLQACTQSLSMGLSGCKLSGVAEGQMSEYGNSLTGHMQKAAAACELRSFCITLLLQNILLAVVQS